MRRSILLPLLGIVLTACGADYAADLEKAEDLVRHQDYDGAYEQFERVSRRFPEEHRPYARLAWLALRRGRPADALPVLEAGIAHGGPESWRIHELLGTLLERLDRPDDAERHYRESLRLHDDQPATVLKLSRVLARRGRYDEALAAAENGIERSPGDVRLRSWYAEMLVKRRRFEDAERSLRETLEIAGQGPATAYPRYVLGLVFLHTGRMEEARSELETAVELEPGIDEVWYQLANVCDRLGDGAARDRALAKFAELYRPKVMP